MTPADRQACTFSAAVVVVVVVVAVIGAVVVVVVGLQRRIQQGELVYLATISAAEARLVRPERGSLLHLQSSIAESRGRSFRRPDQGG